MAAVTRGHGEHPLPLWWGEDDDVHDIGVVRRAADPAHPAAGMLAVALLVVPAVVILTRPPLAVALVAPLLVWLVAAVVSRREGIGWPTLAIEAAGTLGIAAFTAWLVAAIG